MPKHGHAPGLRALQFNMNWITRPLSGLALGVIALGVAAYGADLLAGMLVLATLLAALEWHRCVGAGPLAGRLALVTGGSIGLAAAALLYSHSFWIALVPVAAGAGLVFALARARNPFWQVLGVPYLALAVLALVGLRAFAPLGALVVIGLFVIVWATDTGALVFGRLIGGPRLAPKLSPGKTWAGTLGGSLTAGLAFAGYVTFVRGPGPSLALFLFAFVFSFAAHGGDLFESFVKRRFGLKDSGSLIPGHGGVLDRIDSTLAAAPLLALLVFVAHLNPLFGMQV